MAMSMRDRTEATLSEINVTPLVDVMLVLLIIFMLTAPMLSAAVDVNLQRAANALPAQAKDYLVVTIEKSGRIHVGKDPTTLEALLVHVRREAPGKEGIAIRADREVAHGRVLEVMDRLRGAGFKSVGLVLAPPEERGPRGTTR